MKAAPISIVGDSVHKMTNPGRSEDCFVFGRYASIWLDTTFLDQSLPSKPNSSINAPHTPLKSKPRPKPKSSPQKRNTITTLTPAPKLINNSQPTLSTNLKDSRWAEDTDSNDESEEEWEKEVEEEEEYMQVWGNYTARVDQDGVKVLPSLVISGLVL